MRILLAIGMFMLVFANVGGIGYVLYLWGGTGMAFGLAAWTAFKFWVLWSFVGAAIFIAGIWREARIR